MSRFFSNKFSNLEAYTPGEQPQDRKYIKLNTNESAYPPSPLAVKLAEEASKNVQLYSDPEMKKLIEAASEVLGISKDKLIFTNGSDEILNFAFMAFSDKTKPVVFPNITYGFYPVFAELNGIPYEEIALKEDFSINVNDYVGINKNIFIANPNAPTGLILSIDEIEKIVKSNPDNIVVIDEAYIDFGGESAVCLVDKYSNLLVTRTFSKSRSLAGARLGFGIGNPELIRDLNTIRYSTNPYNVNSMTIAAGIGALKDVGYFNETIKRTVDIREKYTDELRKIGFKVNKSYANFLFAKHPKIGGEKLYLKLKDRGILVRHFNKELIKDYNRITVGSEAQMAELIRVLKEILNEE